MPAYPQHQANQFWCPFVVESGIGGSYNRPGPNASMTDDTTAAPCIGQACSMWRWSSIGQTADTDQGFCGLAGKP